MIKKTNRETISKVLEKTLSKEDKKLIKNSCKKISTLYNRLFSKNIMVLFTVLRITVSILAFSLPLIVSIIIGIFTFVFPNIIKNVDKSSIVIMTDVVFYIASSFVGSIIISIAFSLFTDDEYFDKNEAYIFLSLKTFGLYNFLLLIDIIVNLVFSVISKAQVNNISTITCSVVTIIYSTLILYSFLRFKLSNRINRYFYYLKTRNEYHIFSLDRSIRDCRSIVKNNNIANDESKKLSDILIESAKHEIYGFINLLQKLSQKANNDEDTIKEQNIIETYIEKLFISARSPYQHLIVIVMIGVYYKNYLKVIPKTSKTKNVYHSAERLIDIYINSENKIIKETCTFKVELDKEIIKKLMFSPSKLLTTMDKLCDIISLQRFYLTSKILMVDVSNNLLSFITKKEGAKIKKDISFIKDDFKIMEETIDLNNNIFNSLANIAKEVYGGISKIVEKYTNDSTEPAEIEDQQ